MRTINYYLYKELPYKAKGVAVRTYKASQEWAEYVTQERKVIIEDLTVLVANFLPLKVCEVDGNVYIFGNVCIHGDMLELNRRRVDVKHVPDYLSRAAMHCNAAWNDFTHNLHTVIAERDTCITFWGQAYPDVESSVTAAKATTIVKYAKQFSDVVSTLFTEAYNAELNKCNVQSVAVKELKETLVLHFTRDGREIRYIPPTGAKA